MTSILKSFMALYTAVLIMAMGLGLLSTFLSLRLTLEGFSTQTTGLILTAYFIGSAVGTIYCSHLMKRIGHIRSFGVFAALATAMVMLHGYYVSAFAWAALRFFTGIATIGLFMIIESWLNESATPQTRGRVFSIYMVIYFLGSSAAQQLLNLGNVAGQSLFFIIGLLLVSCIIPVAMTRTRHPRLADVRSVGLKTIMKRAPLGLLGCFAAGLTSSAFYTMGPVFCQQLGLTVSQLSSFMMITVLGGLLFQLPLGSLSDRCDRSIVIPVIGGLFAIISGLMILASQHSFGLFMAGASLFGGLMFSIYPVAVARTHDMFEPRDVVTVSSALLLFHGIGSMMGPMISSSVMALLDNPSGFFVYFSAAGMTFTAVSFLLRQNEFARIIPVEDQVDFRIINHTSQIALQIDPHQKNNGTEVAVKKDPLYTQSPV
ncbi:MFS transporter [Desulfobacula sp.]|uniref:MFS transporter n=1 Tax=Desulfobacula sp. TaxID=2593537 RepID=UPI002604F8F2|nr:MFS transporter [Desulfobacula sp.]